MSHVYYSQRNGTNPNFKGLPLLDVVELFQRVFQQLCEDGYFDEAFGFECVDFDHIAGSVRDVELEILLSVRKRDLWPIDQRARFYSEDDFFDIIEFLYQHVSKPVDGHFHGFNGCGMHWETFNKNEGQSEFRTKINSVLHQYAHQYEISDRGEVLHKPEFGFEQIFEADLPTKDKKISDRVSAAVLLFRRHASTLDDRRQAVRDLTDVLEYLRPNVREFLTSADEKDIFNIANNFGIRHHNDRQKTDYDSSLWLSWMFYFYLSTIHVLLRKVGAGGVKI